MPDTEGISEYHRYTDIAAFRHAHRTQEAFYLRWQKLAEHRKEALRAFWRGLGDWRIFLHVCRYWGVGYKRPLPAGEDPHPRKAVR